MAAALATGLAGCGGQPSRSDAKRLFVADCVNGEDVQRPLCQCVADELERRHGFKTGERFRAANEAVKQGRRPTAVVEAFRACSERLSRAGRS